MLRFLAAVAMLAAAAPGAQLVERVSSERNDYNPSFDRSGLTMVFARSDVDFANAMILVSERRDGSWSEPKPIEFATARFSDSDPWLTPDGGTLYFVSDRPSASRRDKTDLDIWRSHRTESGWSPPEHLGDAVNSPGPELGPEFADGVLTFSSVRKGGLGGLDIYQSRLGPDGFEAPTLLPGPFNSEQSDSDFTLSLDGRMAAFWRGDQNGAIHLSHRTDAGWSAPIMLDSRVNLGPFNFTPAFSADDRSLWYASTRERAGQAKGMADIYVAPLDRN